MLLDVLVLNVYMHEKNAVVGVVIIGRRCTYTVSGAVVGKVVVISVKRSIIVRRSVGSSNRDRRKTVYDKVVIIGLGGRSRDLISAGYDKGRLTEVSVDLCQSIYPLCLSAGATNLRIGNKREGKFIRKAFNLEELDLRGSIADHHTVCVLGICFKFAHRRLIYVRALFARLGYARLGALVFLRKGIPIHILRLCVLYPAGSIVI